MEAQEDTALGRIAGPSVNLLPPVEREDIAVEPRRRLTLERESTFRRSLALADATAVSVSLAVTALLAETTLDWAFLAAPLIFVLLAKSSGVYDRDQHLLHKTTLDEVPALFGLATTATLLVAISQSLLFEQPMVSGHLAVLWLMLLSSLVVLRSIARVSALLLTPPERCLFFGDAASAREFREKLASSHAVKAELVESVPLVSGANDRRAECLPPLDEIRQHVTEGRIDRVIISPRPGSTAELLDAIRSFKDLGVKVSVLPDISRLVSTSVEFDRLNGITLLGVRRFEITKSSQYLKRTFDLVGSSVGLVIAAPLLLVAAIAIKIESPGPLLFRQPRAGRHGKPFRMLKLRSMIDKADALQEELMHLNESDGLFKIAGDPRITRVGRVIRALNIDELPQLINVLRGDMSLVGPRPLVLDEDKRIEGWHRRRLDVRPGITGPWQVLGSSRIPLREMVKLDYQYVADWSLWRDIRILVQTLSHVIRRQGQ